MPTPLVARVRPIGGGASGPVRNLQKKFVFCVNNCLRLGAYASSRVLLKPISPSRGSAHGQSGVVIQESTDGGPPKLRGIDGSAGILGMPGPVDHPKGCLDTRVPSVLLCGRLVQAHHNV
eukprot:CAMPEP_0196598978 /NCGR_PEP_ID=MMETSP1081-20130531/94612_1 /TAXON_ID=36882 /ORGANISM="Pyramimonas amylifera, Strain CCMP720" /LENGTH=119 /DNA_ID=CAMNT_0041924717 /DNA_START=782 /DNA_END=1137 /DNA_ORIENTATION=+